VHVNYGRDAGDFIKSHMPEPGQQLSDLLELAQRFSAELPDHLRQTFPAVDGRTLRLEDAVLRLLKQWAVHFSQPKNQG
jgi:hypothetical protein